MDSGKITYNTSKMKQEKRIKKIIRLVLIIFLLLLLILYLAIGIIYNNGTFSISLDDNLYFEKGIIIYDDPNYKVFRSELFAEAPKTFDNISYKWLPSDIDKHDGSHNGDNYLAYSFYVENIGNSISDYWSEIVAEDSIKKVDEAVRIRLYKNGKDVTYAKKSKKGLPEKNTIPFQDKETVVIDHVEDFKPGDIDRYTIVLWLEGSDPECTDNILGGEFKVYMMFNSELVEK